MNAAWIIGQASNHGISSAEAEQRLAQAVENFAPLIEDLMIDDRTKSLLDNDPQAIEALANVFYAALIYFRHDTHIDMNTLTGLFIFSFDKIRAQM